MQKHPKHNTQKKWFLKGSNFKYHFKGYGNVNKNIKAIIKLFAKQVAQWGIELYGFSKNLPPYYGKTLADKQI